MSKRNVCFVFCVLLLTVTLAPAIASAENADETSVAAKEEVIVETTSLGRQNDLDEDAIATPSIEDERPDLGELQPNDESTMTGDDQTASTETVEELPEVSDVRRPQPLDDPPEERPDLIVVDVWSDTPEPWIDGMEMTYKAMIKNVGDAATEDPFNVEIREAYTIGDETQIDTLEQLEVDPPFEVLETVIIEYGPHIVYAHDYIRAVADTQYDIDESDEGNNGKKMTFINYPDFQIVGPIRVDPPEPELIDGNDVTYEVTIRNQGADTLRDVRVEFYEHYNVDGHYRSFQLAWRPGGVLGSGMSADVSFTNVKARAHDEFEVRVNVPCNIREHTSTQGDNSVSQHFIDYPDFRVTSITADPPEPIDGEEVTYTATIENIGGSTTRNVYVDFIEYYSVNRTGESWLRAWRWGGKLGRDESNEVPFVDAASKAHDRMSVEVNRGLGIREHYTTQGNNEMSEHFIDYPDFSLIEFWWDPPSPTTDPQKTVFVRLHNKGGLTLRQPRVRFYGYYLDDSCEPQDHSIGDIMVPPLIDETPVVLTGMVWFLEDYYRVKAHVNVFAGVFGRPREHVDTFENNVLTVHTSALILAGSGERAYPWQTISDSAHSWTIYTYWNTELNYRITGEYYLSPDEPGLVGTSILRGDGAILSNLYEGNPKRLEEKAFQILLAGMTSGYVKSREHPDYSFIDDQARDWVNSDWEWLAETLDLLDFTPEAPTQKEVYRAGIAKSVSGERGPGSPHSTIHPGYEEFKTIVGISEDVTDLVNILEDFKDVYWIQSLVYSDILGVLDELAEGTALSIEVLEVAHQVFWEIEVIQVYKPYLEVLRDQHSDPEFQAAINDLIGWDIATVLLAVGEVLLEFFWEKAISKIMNAVYEKLIVMGEMLLAGWIGIALVGLKLGLFFAQFTGWEELYHKKVTASYLDDEESIVTEAGGNLWSQIDSSDTPNTRSLTTLRLAMKSKRNLAALFYDTAAEAAALTGWYSIFSMPVHDYIPVWKGIADAWELDSTYMIPGKPDSYAHLLGLYGIIRTPERYERGGPCGPWIPGSPGGSPSHCSDLGASSPGEGLGPIPLDQNPPVAVISQPLNGDTFYSGVEVFFDGSLSDDPDSDPLMFRWTSDIDGFVGSTSQLFPVLSPGNHVITLEVTDGEFQGFDFASISVVEGNGSPIISIASPANGTEIHLGTPLTFDGSDSSDLEGSPLTYQWTSSLEGVFGEESIVEWTPDAGEHVITLTVSDGVNSEYREIEILVHDRVALQVTDSTFAQMFPDAYGYSIVYADQTKLIGEPWVQDRPPDWDIYLIEFPCQTAIEVYRDSFYDQRNPAIDGDLVVWMDNRNGDTNGDGEWDYDIYMKDLSSGIVVQLTNSQENEGFFLWGPRIHGDLVVWADDRNSDESGVNWDIYGYDLSTGQEFQITDDPAHQVDPDVYNGIVVWADKRDVNDESWNIYRCGDAQNPCAPGNVQVSKLTSDVESERHPRIFGTSVVYHKGTAGERDIWMIDTVTLTTSQITTDEADQYNPEIHGSYIVYLDDRYEDKEDPYAQTTSNQHTGIYLYDIDEGEETRLTLQTSWKVQVAISSDIVVWSDNRDEYEDEGVILRDWNIYYGALEIFYPPPDQGGGPSSPPVPPNESIDSPGEQSPMLSRPSPLDIRACWRRTE